MTSLLLSPPDTDTNVKKMAANTVMILILLFRKHIKTFCRIVMQLRMDFLYLLCTLVVEVIESDSSVCLSICKSHVVYHLNGTELRCAPLTSAAHHGAQGKIYCYSNSLLNLHKVSTMNDRWCTMWCCQSRCVSLFTRACGSKRNTLSEEELKKMQEDSTCNTGDSACNIWHQFYRISPPDKQTGQFIH